MSLRLLLLTAYVISYGINIVDSSRGLQATDVVLFSLTITKTHVNGN